MVAQNFKPSKQAKKPGRMPAGVAACLERLAPLMRTLHMQLACQRPDEARSTFYEAERLSRQTETNLDGVALNEAFSETVADLLEKEMGLINVSDLSHASPLELARTIDQLTLIAGFQGVLRRVCERAEERRRLV